MCVLIGVLVVSAAAAHAAAARGPVAHAAYRIAGHRWPGRVIRYASRLRGDDRAALRGAVREWNRSGADVRFAPAGPRRADFRIGYFKFLGRWAGEATTGYVAPDGPVRTPAGGHTRGAHLWLKPPGQRTWDDHQANVHIIAHELGHILGLGHMPDRCAVMSYEHDQVCAQPPHPWQTRCRVLERDDLAGAGRLYGIRPGGLRIAPPFCDSAPPPQAVTDFAGVLDPLQDTITFTWTTPPGADQTVVIEQRICTSNSPDDWDPRTTIQARPGAQTWTDALFYGYLLCYRARIQDRWGRTTSPSVELAFGADDPTLTFSN
jgi:hypothetical protein